MIVSQAGIHTSWPVYLQSSLGVANRINNQQPMASLLVKVGALNEPLSEPLSEPLKSP